MSNKVVLVLVDGMRPDGMLGCGHPFPEKFVKLSAHSMKAQTVIPSVTLPCHMSLIHSVDPDRHGILTNTYVPQVRPVTGLFEQLDRNGKKCAFYYTWEELRDLSRPDHLYRSVCFNQHKKENTDRDITDAAIEYLKAEEPDFMFLYLGETDERGGHSHGWMSPEYMACVKNAWDCIEKVFNNLPDGYHLITTADHGGHNRSHGTTMPEDMTIPICFYGPSFEANKEIEGLSIKDIAPTIAKLLGVPANEEWEGTARC